MVDTTRIDELKQEIGEEDMILVLGIFIAEAEQTIDAIATGLPDAEHAKAIHFLRSGALNIGLNTLASHADAAASVPQDRRADAAHDLHATLNKAIALLGLPVSTRQIA